MSTYALTEQYVLDRLEERAADLFRWVPECGFWVRWTEGGWIADQAEESLRELYCAVVHALWKSDQEEVSRSKPARSLLLQRLSMAAIERAPKLLAFSRALRLPLAEIERKPPEIAVLLDSTEWKEFVLRHLTRQEGLLGSFLTRACACEKTPMLSPFSKNPPRLLIRDHPLAADLSILAEFLSPHMGHALCSVSSEVWGRWPQSLNGPLAYRLHGARLVLLDGVDADSKMPLASLRRIVSGQPVEYRGADRQYYPFTLTAHFALCGPAIHANRLKCWEVTLRESSLALPLPAHWETGVQPHEETLNNGTA